MYKVVSTYSSRKEALQKEFKLHNLFEVDVNELFYNKSKQTSNSFTHDRTGEKLPDEHKKRISEAHKGKTQKSPSLETKAKMGESHKGEKIIIMKNYLLMTIREDLVKHI